MEITTLGPDGTYASAGVRKNFPDASVRFVDTISDVLESASKGAQVVLPLENSIEGTVRLSWDGILERKLKLIGLFKLPVHHVIGTRARNLKSVKKVVSHPQAISQCRKFLARNLPDAKIEYVGSTAEAVKAAKRSVGVAAVSSKYACELYEVPILKEKIEDEKGNVTIFGVVGKEVAFVDSEPDEMHIMVTPRKNMPGLLFDILKPFKDRKIDLTRLESRPTRKKIGEYRFLLSFKLENKKACDTVLAKLRENYKVDNLGSSIWL
jgi:prephenate dehydratase